MSHAQRSRQQGSVRLEGPTWYGFYRERITDPDDPSKVAWRRRRVSVCPAEDATGRPITKTEALQEFTRRYGHQVRQAGAASPLVTVGQFWEESYLPSIRRRLRSRGQEHTISVYQRHVAPFLKDLRLRDVQRADVQHIIDQRQFTGKGLSPQRLEHIKNVISGMFRHAARQGEFEGILPTEFVELPRMTRKKKAPLEPAQLQQFLRTVLSIEEVKVVDQRRQEGMRKVTDNDRRPFWELIQTLAMLGLRIGEAVGLRWFRLNLTDQPLHQGEVVIPPKFLYVVDNWVTTAKLPWEEKRTSEYQETKSVAGERLVPIPDRLEEILKNWLLTTRFPADQDPVFPTIKGRPFDYKNHWRRFGGPVAEELGLKNVSYHSFRHTANTGAGVAGMTPVERQAVFGWTSERMVLRYDHENFERMRAGMNRVAEYLTKGVSDVSQS